MTRGVGVRCCWRELHSLEISFLGGLFCRVRYLRELGNVCEVRDDLIIFVGGSSTGDMGARVGQVEELFICLIVWHGEMEVGIGHIVRKSLLVL